MLTIKDIYNIIGGRLINVDDTTKYNEINDFETIYKYVKSKKTAYISPNKKTWWEQLGRSKNAPEGNDLVDKFNCNIGLIITEKEIEDMLYNIPQIIVEDSVKSLKQLAIYIRAQYKNPMVAITGSMGKSSTRLLTTALLKDYKVLENRGNNNVRAAIYANMLKLIKNPEFAVIEISMNALNNRENTALFLKPDIAVITGIGAAHHSSFQSIKDIARLKSRIFAGLSQNGVAIINEDTMYVDYIKEISRSYTKNIYTYSADKNKSSNFAPVSIKHLKGHIRITLDNDGDTTEYELNTVSDGMVSNALCAILIVRLLGKTAEKEHLLGFEPFSKVLKMKELQNKTHKFTLIDDTHNASLPAMINAIKAFDTQTKFFNGNKIIAIGKINDLGKKSIEIHQELIPYLTKSNADYILCLDNDLKPVVNRINNKKIIWYPNKELMINDLKFLCDECSLTLLKSSSGGTEFPEIAKSLPKILSNISYEDYNISDSDLFSKISEKGKSYIIIDNESNDIISKFNIENSMTIEGMGPLLYYIKAMETDIENRTLKLKEWVTNNDKYFTGKEITISNLIESMAKDPYPSEIYELADYLFKSFKNRKKYLEEFFEEYNISNSSVVNLTGRFRMKERQSFSTIDLLKIYKKRKNELFKYKDSFIIGSKYKSGYIRMKEKTIIFTSFKNIIEVEEILRNFVAKQSL